MFSLYMFHEHTFTDNCNVIKQSAIHFIGLDSIVTGWKEFCKIFNIALIEKKKNKTCWESFQPIHLVYRSREWICVVQVEESSGVI